MSDWSSDVCSSDLPYRPWLVVRWTPHTNNPASKETTVSTPASLPYAFVAKIVAADGQHDALGDLLAGAVELANEEEGTIVWFAVRTHPDTFWIFAAFPEDRKRTRLNSSHYCAPL